METSEKLIERTRPRLACEIYDQPTMEQQAWLLINSRDQIEHDRWEQEPSINARTALFEALTAKGHLSRIEFNEPPELTNQRTLQRLINGWADSLPDWEKQRRFSEIVEELTIHEVYEDIKAGLLPEDTIIITISNFPQGVSEQEATQNGYGVLNQKGMTRTTAFEDEFRVLEQASRSNSNDGSAERFFSAQGLVAEQGANQLLANQIIATKRDFPDGVVSIQQILDSYSGPNVIYGENRHQMDFNVPEYYELRDISAQRELQAESFIKILENYERQLNISYNAGHINYDQKLSALYIKRKELVAQICLLCPDYAKDAMGERSAEYIKQASYAMAAGNDSAGMQHMEMAVSVADSRAGAVCGGSGLESNDINNNSNSDVKLIYLEAKEERKNWKWARGVCVVKECPSRPVKTEVGPCSVCRNCQNIFDKGDTPKQIYKVLGFLDILFESLAEFNRKYDAEQAEKKANKSKLAA